MNSNIVEGYGRRSYKRDYIRFLVFSIASNDETINHSRKLALVYENHREAATSLATAYEQLGKQLNRYITFVRQNWKPLPSARSSS